MVKIWKILGKFLDKTPDVRDLEIQLRLNKLCEKDEFFNIGDGSSSNNFFPPPLPPPPPPPNFPNLRPPPLPSTYLIYWMFQELTNFLITVILNLIIPTVMFYQYLIHYPLGDLLEIFFQTNHWQPKFYPQKLLWEQIQRKQWVAIT